MTSSDTLFLQAPGESTVTRGQALSGEALICERGIEQQVTALPAQEIADRAVFIGVLR